MCGRYTLVDTDALASRYLLDQSKNLKDLKPNYNVAPGQIMPVIIGQEDKSHDVSLMKWGLIPSWAKDPAIGFRMINARAESVAEKPSFKASFKRRRCLVPVNGFYEWKKENKKSIPFYFTVKDFPLFSLAGIWDKWLSPAGTEIQSYTIITTEPNSLVNKVHDRMPVIIDIDNESEWLADSTDESDLLNLLKPFSAKHMEGNEVSRNVNTFVVNDSSLIKPLE